MRWVACMAVVLLVITACGGDDSEETADTPIAESNGGATPTTESDPSEPMQDEGTASDPSESMQDEGTALPEPTATSEPEPTATPAPTNTPTPTATPTLVPTPEPISLSDAGTALTEPVQLTRGIAVIIANHQGASNFTVEIISEASGETVGQPVNQVGTVEIRSAFLVPEDGPYVAQVNADGNWTLEITQPTPATSEIMTPPIEQSGTGPGVFYFVKLDQGVHRVHGTHQGESNFIVQAVSAQGEESLSPQLLFNETGQFEGDAALQVREAGSYLIAVQANGDWTVTIE